MAVTFKGTSLLERNCLLPAKDKCGRTKQDQARRHIKENLARACQEQGASESLTLASLVFWRPGSPCCPSQATPFNPHSCSLWHLKLRVPPPSGSKCVNTAECQMYGNRQGKAIKSISSVISVWVRRLNTHSTTRRNPCLRSWGSKCTRSKLTYWGREGGRSFRTEGRAHGDQGWNDPGPGPRGENSVPGMRSWQLSLSFRVSRSSHSIASRKGTDSFYIMNKDEEKQKRETVEMKELEASENKKGFLFSTLQHSPGETQ